MTFWARKAAILKDFDPNQPRDDHGRWTDVTQTPEFKEWFGDSKVVDENGEPLVVYHGTRESFTVFENFSSWEGLGFHFGTEQAAREVVEQGRHGFRGDDRFLMRVYLSIKNPLHFDQSYDRGRHDPNDVYQMVFRKAEEEGTSAINGLTDQDVDAFYQDEHSFNGKRFADVEGTEKRQLIMEWVESLGYDGYSYDNGAEDVGSKSWVAFRPEQIKSATDNNGEFDPKNPDIKKEEK